MSKRKPTYEDLEKQVAIAIEALQGLAETPGEPVRGWLISGVANDALAEMAYVGSWEAGVKTNE